MVPWCFPAFLFFATVAIAQENEPIAIFEVGAAPGWSTTGDGSTISPTVAVETTPVENWLELELGTTPTFSHHASSWDTDLLFKKPWTLSRKVEFMLGIGPTWLNTRKSGAVINSVGAEFALDFMFWPHANRRFGWYAEPAYEYDFNRTRDQSIGFSAGLLIAVWK